MQLCNHSRFDLRCFKCISFLRLSNLQHIVTSKGRAFVAAHHLCAFTSADVQILRPVESSYQILTEIWGNSFHEKHSFTLQDLKTLCFASAHFKITCQAFVYNATLTARHVNLTDDYAYQQLWEARQVYAN